jgi:hypothetical protein
MKLNILALVALIGAGAVCPVHAEDWKFAFGTYKNVVVTKLDSKCVSFTCDKGDFVMLLSVLPPDIKASLAAKPVAAAPKAPPALPKTITTIYGDTYTDCVLDKITPDGISFMHSTGAAKVPFSSLDPALAAQFGYDPDAAKKFATAEQTRHAKIDADDAAALTQSQTRQNVPPSAVSAPPPAVAPVVSTPAAPAPVAVASAPTSQGKPDKAAIQAQVDDLRKQIKDLQAKAKQQDRHDKAAYDNQMSSGTSSGNQNPYASGYNYGYGSSTSHSGTMSRQDDVDYDSQIKELQDQLDLLQVQL